MADMELRKRLAAAAGLAISDEVLDQIHSRLKTAGEKTKIPLTINYTFEVDENGVFEVSVKSRCNMALDSFKLTLRGDGDQLALPGTETEVVSPPDPPKPKRKVTKAKTETKREPRKGTDEPTPAQKRIMEQIHENNEKMYRDGVISAEEARRVGVDVDAMDAADGVALTPEEREAVKALAGS